MKTFSALKKSKPHRLLHRFTNPKPISSNSQFHNTQNPNQITDPKTSEIESLLRHRTNPISALHHCNRFTPLNRLYEEEERDLFWVLIHILVTFPETRDRARDLVSTFVSSNPKLIPNLTVKELVGSATRFGFESSSSLALNYLLDAYTRTEYGLDCLNLMLDLKVKPFVVFVNNVLSSLVRNGFIDEAMKVYDKLVLCGVFGDNVVIAVLLMRGCLKHRKPEEAMKVFKGVVKPDGLLYSLAVQAACKTRDLVTTLSLLREIKEKLSVPASQETYTSVIVAFVKEGEVEEAAKVKDEMVRFGIPISLIAGTSLVTGYCKRNELCKALDLFESLVPDKVMFTVMLEWLCKNDKMEKAVEIYRRMRSVGIVPSSVLAHTMIQGCLKSESLETALEIFETGLAHDYMGNKILSLLCTQGKVEAATRLLSMMENTSVVSYNNMMLAHCRMRNMGLASSVFTVMMKKGIEPNSFTYSILIGGFFKNHDEEKACDVVDKMISSGFEGSEVVYNTIINGLCKAGKTCKAREMLRCVIKEKRCSMTCTSYNSVIDGFFRQGEPDTAVKTYEEMNENGILPDVVTFTVLINGFCKADRIDLALETRQEMRNYDLKLDIPAYGALIDGFCKKLDMETATSLLSELREQGLIPNVSVYNSMISGFRTLENMDAAIDLYKEMTNDGISCDLFTYTTLIDGLLKDGNIVFASGLYTEMLASGIVPDNILKTVFVNGLSKKGQFARARTMLVNKDMTPNVLTYSTVIAGHYREGNLDEAFRLRDEMLEKGLVEDDALIGILVSGNVRKPNVVDKVSSFASPYKTNL